MAKQLWRLNMSDQLCIYHLDFNFVNIKPSYLRIWLRRVANAGYNAILWELEDKVQWETCSEAVWPEAMSKQEFRELLNEASELGLEAIPLLQTIGHGEYILKQKAYAHMRELPERHDCYCTERPETRSFLKSLIREYLDLFGDIKHFHLGGDEAYVFAKCPVCSKEADSIGHNALYARHIIDISSEITARGVRPGIWCDMALHHPEQMDAIPHSLEIWDWNYHDIDGPVDQTLVWGKGLVRREDITPDIIESYPEIIGKDGKLRGFYTADMLNRKGYDVILCSAARSAGDSFFCPQTRKHAGNIAGAARKTAVSGLTGTCVTDWAIRLNSWETRRDMLPLAPMILNNPEMSLSETRQKNASSIFNCDASEFLDAIDTISGIIYPFSQAHSSAIQWNGMKDSLPAPPGYIKNLLETWAQNGRLKTEQESIETVIPEIIKGIDLLNKFIARAESGLDFLQFWTKAAWFQLWHSRMAKEILHGNKSPENIACLKTLKNEYEQFLLFDQTPRSAAQNANLVYNALIEYMET